MLSKRILPGRCIQPDRNEQHDGKSHERRTTVADQRQGNSHHRHQSDGHPHINEQMKKQECRNAVTVDPSERLLLPFAHTHQPEYQQAKERQQKHSAQKSPLLADGTENEIGMFLRHETVFDLGPLQEPFADPAARTDSDLGLIDVIIRTEGITDQPQET